MQILTRAVPQEVAVGVVCVAAEGRFTVTLLVLWRP